MLALEVQSVQALWFFTSDLVFVLLFPQLVFALFDRQANRIGSMAAFGVSLVLRLGGGEPLFGIPPIIPYPRAAVRPASRSAGELVRCRRRDAVSRTRRWRPLAGLVTLPLVSRLTARWDPPRRAAQRARRARPTRNRSSAAPSRRSRLAGRGRAWMRLA